MCVVESQLKNVLTCPHCGRRFAVRDTHRPFRCPHCGAVIVVGPPAFQPEVLYTPRELVQGGRE